MTHHTAHDLAGQQCKPCTEGTEPIKGDDLRDRMQALDGWRLVEDKKIVKDFRFSDFSGALDFVNRVGDLAERQDHHPDIHLSWGLVVVELWTHKIGGLSENDFIMAAKIDELPH